MTPDIFEFSSWIDSTSSEIIVETFNNILEKSNFKVLNFIDYRFNPHGYTAVWLLCESHFAIHTFPEKNKSYIQLSSCSKEKHDIFIAELKETVW